MVLGIKDPVLTFRDIWDSDAEYQEEAGMRVGGGAGAL